MADTINIATKSAGDTLTSGEFNQVVEKTNAAITEVNENKAENDLKEQQQDTALSNEASVRAQADTVLSEAITTEAQARADADEQKVDKVEGKGLSTEDYTTEEKSKLEKTQLSTKSFELSEDIIKDKFVQLLNDGMIESVKEEVTPTQIPSGEETEIMVGGNSSPGSLKASFIPNSNNKLFVAYSDSENSNHGTAVLCTIDGDSITFGSPVVFNNAATSEIALSFPNDSSNKFVIAYKDEGNSSYGTAVLCTIDGDSITFGSPVVFYNGYTNRIMVSFDSNSPNKFIIVYSDGQNSYEGTAIIGEIDNNSITFGNPSKFPVLNGTSKLIISSAPSSLNNFIIAYYDAGNSDHGTAVLCTIDGDSMTLGSPVVFNNAPTSDIALSFPNDSSNKFVIAYTDEGNSNYGTAVLGEIDGDSITFGSSVVFNNAATSNASLSFPNDSSNKFVVAYKDDGNSNQGTAVLGAINDVLLTFDGPYVYNSASTYYPNVATSIDKFLVFYAKWDSDISDMVFMVIPSRITSSFANIEAEKLLGKLKESGSAGEIKPVLLLGNILSGFTGLTIGSKYYLQTDGSVSADSSGVLIGRAVSTTEIESKKTF